MSNDHHDNVDVREQLCNDRRTGPIPQVQLPLECVTKRRAIMFDLDPDLLVPGNPFFPPGGDPRERTYAEDPLALARDNRLGVLGELAGLVVR
jgi:hypothetical protein